MELDKEELEATRNKKKSADEIFERLGYKKQENKRNDMGIGKRVMTYDGHTGIVIKHFKPTGRENTVHIREDDGRIYFCPESDIVKNLESW